MHFSLAAELAGDDAIEHECSRISGKLASVGNKECLARKLEISDGRSVQNAPILVKEYPPLSNRKPLGKVLLFGGIHGDEYSSVSIVFKWMSILDQFHSGLFHWQIVPLLNPDGLLREKSQRVNENSVDLNRNFPTPNWVDEANHYWIEKTKRNPRRYPGENALSEPETRWLVEKIGSFEPDVIVTVHAPHGIVDYDGPQNGPYKLGRLYLNLLGTYPGSLGRYAGVLKQIPVVTIELPYAGIMPKPKEISHIWRDLIRWLREHIPANNMKFAQDHETDPS
jgi:hypothetical protein